MGRMLRGERTGRTPGVPAGSRHESRRACRFGNQRGTALQRFHSCPAWQRAAVSPSGRKLRMDDENRFHGGCCWGMVGGSSARAATSGATGAGFVSGRARRAVTATVVGGALGLLAVSCGGGSEKSDDKPRRTTTTEETTTTLDPEEAARQAVIDARQAAADAEIDALAPPKPNPDLPTLEETHTGLMLDRMKETAGGLAASGIAVRFPTNSKHRLDIDSIRFQTVEGQEVAFIEVCTVDDSERVQVSSGKVAQSGVVTIKSSEAMKKIDGVWKLAERRQDSVEEGVTGCAID